MTADPGARSARRSLWLLSAAHAASHLPTSLYALVYPFAMHALGFGYAQMGLLVGLSGATFGITQGVHGWLSRWVRRKSLAGGGGVLAGLCIAASGLSGGFPSFLGWRLSSGLALSPHHPMAASLLSDAFPGQRRASALSFHFVAGNVGSLLTPIAAGLVLARFGWRDTLLLFGLPGVLAGSAVWLGVGERARPERRRSPERRLYRELLASPRVRLLVVASAFIPGGRGLGVLLTYVPLFLASHRVFSPPLVAVALTILIAGGIAGPAYAGRLADRAGAPLVVAVSLWLSALAMVALLVAGPAVPWALAAVALLGLCVFNEDPLTQALLASGVPAGSRDAAFAVFYSLSFAGASVLGAAVGLVIARWGFTAGLGLVAALFVATSAAYLRLRRAAAAPAD